MNVLVIGGTRFFGVPMIRDLISRGHDVTMATRGQTKDVFGNQIQRIVFDRSDEQSIKDSLGQKYYDVIIDKIAFSSNDVKRLLDNVKCGKYIFMSSAAVYEKLEKDTKESDFDAGSYPLRWEERKDYAEGKRQAECALAQHYRKLKSISVRYPVVIGENDYTNRLRFYIDSILDGTPIFVDDLDAKISFIHESEAGLFLSHLVDCDLSGAVNGCSIGCISPAEIISYIEQKTGYKAILSADGKSAPYNGYPEFATLDIKKAIKSGFTFLDINTWIFKLIDYYICEHLA